MPRTSALSRLSPVLVLNNTRKCQVGAVTVLVELYPAALRALHDTATCASARVGLTPTMAAAVVKLIGPDMPTSGLHVSLETVSTHVEKVMATQRCGWSHGRVASHAALAGTTAHHPGLSGQPACSLQPLWPPVGAALSAHSRHSARGPAAAAA